MQICGMCVLCFQNYFQRQNLKSKKMDERGPCFYLGLFEKKFHKIPISLFFMAQNSVKYGFDV